MFVTCIQTKDRQFLILDLIWYPFFYHITCRSCESWYILPTTVTRCNILRLVGITGWNNVRLHHLFHHLSVHHEGTQLLQYCSCVLSHRGSHGCDAPFWFKQQVCNIKKRTMLQYRMFSIFTSARKCISMLKCSKCHVISTQYNAIVYNKKKSHSSTLLHYFNLWEVTYTCTCTWTNGHWCHVSPCSTIQVEVNLIWSYQGHLMINIVYFSIKDTYMAAV